MQMALTMIPLPPIVTMIGVMVLITIATLMLIIQGLLKEFALCEPTFIRRPLLHLHKSIKMA